MGNRPTVRQDHLGERAADKTYDLTHTVLSDSHAFLRFGIDKVFLSIYPRKVDEQPYDKEAAKRFWHRLTRVRYKNRASWAATWTWTNDNNEPIISYFLTLEGQRVMHVHANLMRYYLSLKGINSAPYAYDDNVAPPEEHFQLTYFCDLLTAIIGSALEDYRTHYNQVFQTVAPQELVASLHQIEFVCEGINRHISDTDPMLSAAHAHSMVRYFDNTATVYLNPSDEEASQVKFYQKAPTVLRQEVTLNGRDAQDLSNDYNVERLARQAATVLVRYNIGWLTNLPDLSEQQRLALWASFLNIDQGTLKTILHATSWQSTRSNRSLTLRLIRRKLMSRTKRGEYSPTEFLSLVRNSIEGEPELSHIDLTRIPKKET